MNQMIYMLFISLLGFGLVGVILLFWTLVEAMSEDDPTIGEIMERRRMRGN